MFARNVSVHLKSNMLSDDTRTFKKDIRSSLRKQNGIRKLIIGGMMLGLLTGVCFAQRAAPSARPAPSASPIPSASPAVPSASPVGPRDMTQQPPIPPNTVVSPDAAPPSPQH